MGHKSGPSIADVYAYKRRTGQVRACHEADGVDGTWGRQNYEMVSRTDMGDVDAVVVEET